MVGRPKIPKNLIRIGFSITLTLEEKHEIDERATKKGMNFSQYIRSVLFPITLNDCSSLTEKQKTELAKNLVCPKCGGDTIYSNKINLIEKEIILFRLCVDCFESYKLTYRFDSYEEFESLREEINKSTFSKNHLDLLSNSLDDLVKLNKTNRKR